MAQTIDHYSIRIEKHPDGTKTMTVEWYSKDSVDSSLKTKGSFSDTLSAGWSTSESAIEIRINAAEGKET